MNAEMQKYQIQNSIGNGNFSVVYKALTLPDQKPCAIKVMKSHHKIAMREAQLLRKFKHPNIISIIDFEQTDNESRLVLEYIGINTLQLYQSNSYGLRQEQVKCILFQVALGLSCVHSYGIIHRDIKPQNILIDKKLAIVKLIDFGLAIDQSQVSTDYIATRWYRAPENLLGTREYTCAIDVFSLGCVIVELYLGSALFPGSNNIDQLYKIFNILGYPTSASWPKGFQKMHGLGLRPHHPDKKAGIDLKSIMNPCDPKLVDIIQKMLQLNPKHRITCSEILKHQYFHDIKSIVPPSVFRRYEQDIVGVKPLSFKGFQTGQTNKVNSIHQQGKKIPQINFHNVSSKLKQNRNGQKIIQKPQFLRQKKSSSLDSAHSFKSVEKKLQYSNLNVLPLAHSPSEATVNRKLSTPSLIPQAISQQNLIKSKNDLPRLSPEQQFKKSFNSSSRPMIETIQQQKQKQLKISIFVPDLSQTTNSGFSKNQPSPVDLDNKYLKSFAHPETARNTFPFIQNMQFQVALDKNFKVSARMNSPPSNLNYINNQSFTNAHNLNEQYRRINTNFQLRSVHMNVNPQKVEPMTSPLDQSLNSKNYKSFEVPHKFQHIEQRRTNNNVNIKQINSFKELQVQKTSLKQLYTSPSHANSQNPQINTSRPEGITSRNMVHRSPQHESRSFLSPSHQKVYMGMGTQDQMLRNRRMVAVNSPVQNFYSPPTRRL